MAINTLYFFIHDYSLMTWAHFLKHKSKSFDMFLSLKNMIENKIDKRIKYLILIEEDNPFLKSL